MISDARLAALRTRMADESVDALAVIDPVNVVYLTGFETVFDAERPHIVVVTSDTAVFITDNRYIETAKREAEGGPWRVHAIQVGTSLVEGALAQIPLGEGATLAVEDSILHREMTAIEEHFAGELRIVRGWVEDLRSVKEEAEIERIAAAQALTDEAFDHILGYIRAGMTERDIALELEFFMRKRGADGVAFSFIVASGPNSALPHAVVSDRVIGEGEFLKMDFGARVDGYCSDMTRTVVIGTATDRMREIYSAVRAANEAAHRVVRAGVVASEVHEAARRVLADAGLAELFTHGLGHGVGLAIHEGPSVSVRSSQPLVAGNVITIEPGVYVPGSGGVRIEDLVAVEPGGARVFTRSPKDLIEL